MQLTMAGTKTQNGWQALLPAADAAAAVRCQHITHAGGYRRRCDGIAGRQECMARPTAAETPREPTDSRRDTPRTDQQPERHPENRPTAAETPREPTDSRPL